MIKNIFRDLILSQPLLKAGYVKARSTYLERDLISRELLDEWLNEADVVSIDPSILKDKLHVGLVRTDLQYDKYVKQRDYSTKYERFLKTNSISYSYFDPFQSDWIEKAKNFSLIVWHTRSDPSSQAHAQDKIFILNNKLGIKTFPTLAGIASYENKLMSHYLYSLYNLPEIPTFVTYSQEEARRYIDICKFPLIAKIATGSSSLGVKKIKNKRDALKIVNKAFSYKGLKTYFPYHAQKDYIYFQEMIEDAEYDLRVIAIGNKLFGYYRYPKGDDFRASGSGIYEKKEIPVEALELAYKTKESFGEYCLATDMVYSKTKGKYLIIESSIFIGVDSCVQLSIDGIPGYYMRDSESSYTFCEGKYWIQELSLKEFIESNF
ncbi:hypothetical protein QD172_13815 [Cobetia sp. 10Alg 146]|uniref:ATP-grasp domain-containing protein n=1 Tax=Cobetia sp. 10Alg 146 TaxID=3040019 RepID=UPI00244A3A2F|nr:hypothetical protein [Cobetia sp. 10Alg 146]MDH2292319.1 hypothetical protein [Cobetia sp. 10Alg 146]